MSKVKILVVEDEPISQRVARLLLENQSYEVDIAGTAKDAIHLLSHDNYQIVFMDIGLPDMLGTEATHYLKAIAPTTPIIALTAHGTLAEADCLKAGMNDFMTKPIMDSSLRIMLAKWLHGKCKQPAT